MWCNKKINFNFVLIIVLKMKKQILINFGERVRKFRKEKNMSQEDLADKAGFHRTYIGMIERAEKNITLTNIEKIAKALQIEITDLLINNDEITLSK